jgi:hypothetical protein
MSTPYLINRDISGTTNSSGAGLTFALDGFSGALAANTEQHFVVPASQRSWMVIIVPQTDKTVYVDGIKTAVVAAGSLSATTTEIIPECGLIRYVKGGQTLSFITAEAGGSTITVKLYAANLYTNVM